MSRFLLDTHLFLWAAQGAERVPPSARTLMGAPEAELIVSAASLWEIAIKSSLGRPDFRIDPHLLRRRLLENGYQELAISGAHAVATAMLPHLHKDPFDRLLVAQAMVEGIVLLTADSAVAAYGGPVQLV